VDDRKIIAKRMISVVRLDLFLFLIWKGAILGNSEGNSVFGQDNLPLAWKIPSRDCSTQYRNPDMTDIAFPDIFVSRALATSEIA